MSAKDSTARRASIGLIGTLGIALVVLGAIQYQKLPLLGPGAERVAEFREAGGLEVGNDVIVSGATVGEVSSIELDGDRVDVGYTLTEAADDLDLGDSTGARIVTVTLLGHAALELQPAGDGELEAGEVIPVERTTSPYDITTALADLTTRSEQIDVEGLTAAFGEVSTTFEETPEDVRATLEGLGSLSEALVANDGTLQELLGRAENVSGVLASRNEELATLLTSGQSLLAELTERQQVVVDLLANTQDLAAQLNGLVADNDDVLGPALTQLNGVIALLNENAENLQNTITGARNYAVGFGEAVSSGPFFDAYIQNLTSPGSLLPIVSGLLDEGALPDVAGSTDATGTATEGAAP